MAMNTGNDGAKSPAAIPWKPFCTPNAMADSVNTVKSAI